MDSAVRPWSEVISRALVQAVPYAGDSLVMVLDQALVRRRSAAQSVAQEIATYTGADELGRRLADDRELEALFMQGIDAAVRTGVEAKRRLLAKVIAQAVLDDARVDPAHLYVMALQDLEAPHLRALERLRRVEQAAQDSSLGGKAADQLIGEAWDAEPIPVQAALSRTGCVRTAGSFLVAGELVTKFGHDLIEHLREFDQAEQLVERSST
jgi:ribosomal protein L18